MNRKIFGLGAGATAVAAGVVAAGAAVIAARRGARGPDRWHTVTIYRAPDALGSLPPPLDKLGMPVEVRITPAPGDRGTELAARIPRSQDGHEDVGRLRTALREARSIAETGEVLTPDAPPTAHPTPLGRPLAYATRHAREEGRL